MALLGQFRQAEDITGSFDETVEYRSCRSPLELCSMWSLRVTNVVVDVYREVLIKTVKRLRITSTADSVLYRDLLRCTML